MPRLDLTYRELLRASGLTQTAAAAQARTTQSIASRVISGRLVPSSALRDRLDVTLALGSDTGEGGPMTLLAAIGIDTPTLGFLSTPDGAPAAFKSRDYADQVADLFAPLPSGDGTAAVTPCAAWPDFYGVLVGRAGLPLLGTPPLLDVGEDAVRRLGDFLRAYGVLPVEVPA